MDGWRCVAYVENGACELVSRNRKVYKSFSRLTSDIARLPVLNAIIDAELVCLNEEGKSVFMDLMLRRKSEAIPYAFDLLWLNGEDLRDLPLIERKRRLRRLVKGHDGFLYAEQIQDQGTALFEAICAKDLEGIVAKHRLGPYAAIPATWFKVLNPDYSQKRGRREMFDTFRERAASSAAQGNAASKETVRAT